MSLTRACAFLGCSWLVALAACGGDGGSTDVEPTLRFADRTDTELLRLIDAAGGTDLFRATGMIDQFGDTFEIEPCPTITIAGSVATVTGGCARADGSRLEGTGAVDNPIGWDQLDYEFQNDTLYTFTGFGLTQDQTTQTFDGWLRRSDGLRPSWRAKNVYASASMYAAARCRPRRRGRPRCSRSRADRPPASRAWRPSCARDRGGRGRRGSRW
jgi:hypothetical protein